MVCAMVRPDACKGALAGLEPGNVYPVTLIRDGVLTKAQGGGDVTYTAVYVANGPESGLLFADECILFDDSQGLSPEIVVVPDLV